MTQVIYHRIPEHFESSMEQRTEAWTTEVCGGCSATQSYGHTSMYAFTDVHKEEQVACRA